jgi:hypothetical protein
VSEDVKIKEFHMKAGEPTHIVAQGPAVMHLVSIVGQAFIESGAPNYLSIAVTHDELGPMEVLVRRTYGKTVAQVSAERLADYEALRSQLARFRDSVLHQSGPLDNNGMTSDQVNDVLALFDDELGSYLPTEEVSAKAGEAK